MHLNKGKTLAQSLKDRTDYAQNPEKTRKGNLVTGYKCDPMTVDEEFLLSKRQYEHITGRTQKSDVIAYQIRQSFKPGEITPEKANAVGFELAMRFTKGKHAFIVATHTDKAHIHNHIIFNSTTLDCKGKFRDFHQSGLALQKLSDIICLEHDLSVIDKDKSIGGGSSNEKEQDGIETEQGKTEKVESGRKHSSRYSRYSVRDQIRDAIDVALAKKPQSFEELIELLQKEGFEYKAGKQPSLRGKNQQRFIRFSSLGEGYSVDELKAVIAGRNAGDSFHGNSRSRRNNQNLSRMSFLIDIQAKINEGKGKGYVQWAKVFNLKQQAKALLFVQEHGISNIDELKDRTAEMSDKCDSLLKSVKDDEANLKEISELRMHIINYAKSKDIFAEYRKSGYSKDYYENHREILALRQAAKQAFDEYKRKNGPDKPLPRVKDLNTEYSRILDQKKKHYSDYKEARSESRDWKMACRIIQTIMDEKSPEHENTRE